MSFKDISIVIPTHRNPHGVETALRSIQAQELAGMDVEVLVVSNLPDSQLKHLADRQWNIAIRWLVSGVLGVNSARNLGVEEALGRYIYFLDDDCVLLNSSHLKSLMSDTQEWAEHIVGAGGGYVLPVNSRLLDMAYLTTCQHWLDTANDPQGAYHLVGGNALFTKSLFEKGYTFNESIEFGGAETEFNLRLKKQGFRFHYSPKFNVRHDTYLSLGRFLNKAFMQGMGLGIREYYGSADSGVPSQSVGEYLKAQPFSGLALMVLQFYLWAYDLFFMAGYHFFARTKKNRPSGFQIFYSILSELERRFLSFCKGSFWGRFYQRGKKTRVFKLKARQ